MNQQEKVHILNSNGKNSDYGPSPTKSQIQMRRDKKKKMTAFKTFLNKIELEDNSDPLAKRRLSGEMIEQKVEKEGVDPQCKICNLPYGQKGKDCNFCLDTVCTVHIRKKRRDPNTNKYARICDLCEDTYLYKKYLKNQMKIEETLVAQQLLLEVKLNQIKEVVSSKRIKLKVLGNKSEELINTKMKETQKHANTVIQLQRKNRKLQEKVIEITKLQKQLIALDKRMPPSLQDDYQFLVSQNERITKDLVKYEKLCNDIVKARSQREKTMYAQYYEWQLMEKHKRNMTNKEEQCSIY